MKHQRSNGFTLIELLLAMSFVAILLIAVAVLTIAISNLYTRGITLRDVNQSGQALSDELLRTVAQSPIANVDNGTFVTKEGGGRLCLGTYTYAWNYGTSINENPNSADLFNHYADKSDVIRFVKVADSNRALCRPDSDNNYPVIADSAVELLDEGDRNLAIHSFSISQGEDTALFTVNFTLGTNRSGTLDGLQCRAPSDAASDIDYCAVNEFEIITRSGVV